MTFGLQSDLRRIQLSTFTGGENCLPLHCYGNGALVLRSKLRFCSDWIMKYLYNIVFMIFRRVFRYMPQIRPN